MAMLCRTALPWHSLLCAHHPHTPTPPCSTSCSTWALEQRRLGLTILLGIQLAGTPPPAHLLLLLLLRDTTPCPEVTATTLNTLDRRSTFRPSSRVHPAVYITPGLMRSLVISA